MLIHLNQSKKKLQVLLNTQCMYQSLKKNDIQTFLNLASTQQIESVSRGGPIAKILESLQANLSVSLEVNEINSFWELAGQVSLSNVKVKAIVHEILYSESLELSAEDRDPNYITPIGNTKIMRKDDHVTITVFSKMIGYSLMVIICEVFNLRSYRPQNRDNIIENVKKIGTKEGWAQSRIRTEIVFQLWNEEHLNI